MTVASAVPCQVKSPARARRGPGSPRSASACRSAATAPSGSSRSTTAPSSPIASAAAPPAPATTGTPALQRGQRRGPEEHRAAQVGQRPGPADDRGRRLPGVGHHERHGRVAPGLPGALERVGVVGQGQDVVAGRRMAQAGGRRRARTARRRRQRHHPEPVATRPRALGRPGHRPLRGAEHERGGAEVGRAGRGRERHDARARAQRRQPAAERMDGVRAPRAGTTPARPACAAPRSGAARPGAPPSRAHRRARRSPPWASRRIVAHRGAPAGRGGGGPRPD